MTPKCECGHAKGDHDRDGCFADVTFDLEKLGKVILTCDCEEYRPKRRADKCVCGHLENLHGASGCKKCQCLGYIGPKRRKAGK
jgi:hypothetical protein